jgi:Family of unknown function (DUF6065)
VIKGSRSALPPNTIRACVIPGADIIPDEVIRPCTVHRDWMGETPQKFIYKCMPLAAANTMGWELFNPVDADVFWNGSDMNTDIQVSTLKPDPFAPKSHFGCGMVTWYLPFLFRTSPELGLIATGPSNHGRDDAIALDAFIRTDWLPFPFTMSWRLTRRNETVHFSGGEPICRIIPFPIAMLDETTLEITALEDDPGFLSEVNAWGSKRQENVAKQAADAALWIETGEKPTGEGVWNSQYVRARGEGEEGFLPHQTVFSCAAAVDKRVD